MNSVLHNSKLVRTDNEYPWKLAKIIITYLPNDRVTVTSSHHNIFCIDEVPTTKKKKKSKIRGETTKYIEQINHINVLYMLCLIHI